MFTNVNISLHYIYAMYIIYNIFTLCFSNAHPFNVYFTKLKYF